VNKLDFAAINRALNAETLVPQWLPGGQRRGVEWVSSNPMRNDKNPGSFSINLTNGIWKDFAGDKGDYGTDLVSLYAYLFHDNDQGAAAKELASDHHVQVTPAMREAESNNVKQIDEAKPKLIFPVPPSAPAASFKHPQYGMPTRTWTYRTAKGEPLLHVCRYEPAGMRKQIIPRSWCMHHDGTERWTWRGITGKAKRPLYNLDMLTLNADADAIVVEGEKAADAGQAMMNGVAVVTTWMGGVETSDRVSVAALAGRRVILFPDQDAQRVRLTREEETAGVDPDSKPIMPLHEQPGMRAMMNLANALKGVAREVIIVGYTPDEERAGWDLDDAQADGWDGKQVLAYIAANAGDPWHVVTKKPVSASTPATPAAPSTPIDASVNPFGYPHMGDKGQPLNTLENLDYLIGEYGISAKYNQIRKQVELTLPERNYTADNRANCGLAELTSICARNKLPQSMLQDYVKVIADRNSYNPVCDWITSKPWDGVTRLPAIYKTVKASMDDGLKCQLMYRWLMSAVASVFMPAGFTSHGVLVFTGPQGQGKTSWVKSLVPQSLGVVLEGAAIDPNNKDTVVNVVSHWLVEFGELDGTFRKADIARLKSFVTQAVDKLRRPYDRIESEYQRRCVFFASVNESQYLVDDTGNRRWWTIPVTGINYSHGIDAQQLWAELLTHFQAGAQHWLMPEEQDALNSLNENHEATDPISEQIMAGFEWGHESCGGCEELTATEVLLACGFDKPNKMQATHASKVLKKLTGAEPKKRNNGRFFTLPQRTNKTKRHNHAGPF
jgi:predicted P-loop ATPase